MLRSTENRGFSMKFENNLTISVQFGIGNYCERRNTAEYGSEMQERIVESSSAEIAIWDENKNWLNFDYDTVKGYISANEVAQWIERTSKAASFDELQSTIPLEAIYLENAPLTEADYWDGDKSDKFAQ